MSRDERGHMRFIGGTIYCPRMERRYNLGLGHPYPGVFVCPGCGVKVPVANAREALAGEDGSPNPDESPFDEPSYETVEKGIPGPWNDKAWENDNNKAGEDG